ncbi:MAG: hypothetical protein GTO45_13690 [Candidatus Aminicenantes bacterium]|nr:hypothetical protein [Candidatus Aminicenantes bacterium]NIM79828.1 hypothetical protein [Candidatus Aminicenantes bacterium]NIN19158.1 hypothetical protein [Candidatus Aminicenantes bacterium]NIN43062.1 hypothetical protein [Candidatus Aminicenantes bacterium]NIN85803.1 hypothetical protein [Candidatus Aminicenantes bacterium]
MKEKNFHDDETKKVEKQEKATKRKIAERLDAIGWALFFIWVGIAFLAELPTGVGLLGVGVITLGGQAARKYFHLEAEGFWVVVGSLFVLGGVWELLNLKIELIPVLCVVAGFALLVSIFRDKKKVHGCCACVPGHDER